jgi:anti-sigma factor RsiW
MNPHVNSVTDDDLVLYRYRDGLDADRIAEITAALAASPALRERYASIERAIAQFDQGEIAPDPELGARLWQRLEPHLAEAGVLAAPSSRFARKRSFRYAWIPLAAAAVLIVAVGLGFLVGRHSTTAPTPIASTPTDASAARVLDAYVAANLRATEGVLLTASNSGDASLLEGNRELAQSIVESNRLYALAAERAGNAQLANFLRQLEPVLLSLANQPGAATVQSSEDLRRFLDATDLLFQVRAIEARLDRNGERRT